MDNSFVERIRHNMKNATFCYAKEGGQGFVAKKECSCTKRKPCQEAKDIERFHRRFEELEHDNTLESRKRIIEIIKPEFTDSNWWKNNVVE